MEAYGAKLGRKYCDLEHRDFRECITSEKQKKRAKAIATQRLKLYWEGKLDKCFLENHPPPGQGEDSKKSSDLRPANAVVSNDVLGLVRPDADFCKIQRFASRSSANLLWYELTPANRLPYQRAK
ncbi:hypothetical protein OSTOST_06150 [Ostertagia ostertagi]